MKQVLSRIFSKPGLALELAVASFFINILVLAAPFFFILVFNRYLTGGVDGTLVTLTVGMLMAVAIQFLFRIIRTRMAGQVGIQAEDPLVRSLFDALTRSRIQAISQVRKSRIVQSVNSLHTLQAAYSAPNVNSVLDMPYSFLFIGVIFLLNFQLGVVAALGALATFASAWFAMFSSRKAVAALQESSAGNQVLVDSAVKEPETLRVFGGTHYFAAKWSEQLRNIITLRGFSAYNEDVSQARLMSIGLVSRTFIIALGARQVFLGELTIGALIGISILSSMPLTILARFVRTTALLKRAAEAESVLKRFMMLPREKTSGSALKVYSGGLDFKDLAFVYPGSKSPLFEGLNIQVAPGTTAGFTGYNGSGKSTLARMVAGLLEPSRGQILVDGMEMSQISLEWWRKQIIYLPQEPGFLPATIRENIMAVSPDMDNDGLNRVLYTAGLRRFLDSHPQGLDLELDERGTPLPLGIRRRLALARALTTDGQLVILDEPAEGLDVEGWKMVNRTIKSLRQSRKTILIFSGDPRLLMDADIIVDLGSKPVPEIAAK
ncbi:MAG: ATP-binding cassette domain-containing protein, partial [Desulfonatronovibrio sp.]